MITAVDTNVLIDVFAADPQHGPASREALRASIAEGSLTACEAVWAEVAAGFQSAEEADDELGKLGVRFEPLGRAAALAAGEAFARYRERGGARERIVADFLIAAHAQHHADRLLTRDRGFYRSCFEDLALLDPTAPFPGRPGDQGETAGRGARRGAANQRR